MAGRHENAKLDLNSGINGNAKETLNVDAVLDVTANDASEDEDEFSQQVE